MIGPNFAFAFRFANCYIRFSPVRLEDRDTVKAFIRSAHIRAWSNANLLNSRIWIVIWFVRRVYNPLVKQIQMTQQKEILIGLMIMPTERNIIAVWSHEYGNPLSLQVTVAPYRNPPTSLIRPFWPQHLLAFTFYLQAHGISFMSVFPCLSVIRRS